MITAGVILVINDTVLPKVFSYLPWLTYGLNCLRSNGSFNSHVSIFHNVEKCLWIFFTSSKSPFVRFMHWCWTREPVAQSYRNRKRHISKMSRYADIRIFFTKTKRLDVNSMVLTLWELFFLFKHGWALLHKARSITHFKSCAICFLSVPDTVWPANVHSAKKWVGVRSVDLGPTIPSIWKLLL